MEENKIKQIAMCGNVIYVAVTNLEDFNTLIRKAESQTEELNKTINKLRNFDIKMEIKKGKQDIIASQN